MNTHTKICINGYKKGNAKRIMEKFTILCAVISFCFRKPLIIIARAHTNPGKATNDNVSIHQR